VHGGCQQVGHWQASDLPRGSVHWNQPLQTPMHAQVGAVTHFSGVVTHWNVGPDLSAKLAQRSPAYVQTSHEATSEHSETGRQEPS
jgi:hypothetical protein